MLLSISIFLYLSDFFSFRCFLVEACSMKIDSDVQVNVCNFTNALLLVQKSFYSDLFDFDW